MDTLAASTGEEKDTIEDVYELSVANRFINQSTAGKGGDKRHMSIFDI